MEATFETVAKLFSVILGKRVSLKVVALHEEARKIDDNDDEERIAEKTANPKDRTEFEILDGPYKGITKKSGSASNHPHHALGDVTTG